MVLNIHLLNPQRTTSGVPIKSILNTSVDRGIQGSLNAAVAQGITASEPDSEPAPLPPTTLADKP